jgi:hypothetical protein
MGTVKEQRSEKRLRYRWHARFASNPKQKPLSGQMVDISSKGMALLYHNDDSCPGQDQLITTNFGVPHFGSGGSFDTVFFNRVGRVCRIDNLTGKVNRIAIQFAEPLFFKPGEQDISDTDAKQRLEAKAQQIVGAKEKTKTRRKTGADNEAKSYADEIARFYSDALAGTEERIRSYAEAKTRAEEKAIAENKARVKAEAKVKTEAKLRAKAEKKAESEVKKREKIESELQKKADFYSEQLAKIKAEAAKEIANIKAGQKPDTLNKKTSQKKNKSGITKPSGEGMLMNKVDKFITSRNRIF